MSIKLAFASDHGGYNLKRYLMDNLDKSKYEAVDVGCSDCTTSVDYPDFAHKGVELVKSGQCKYGIFICGTGIGISIAANKHKGIRAGLCHSEYDAEMTRRHNNANILAMGERTTGQGLALSIMNKFLATEFEGGRH